MGEYRDIALTAVGDWNKQIDVSLVNAMMAGIEICGRSGRQACEMAMIYMARSARRMTKQAEARRKVKTGTTSNNVAYKYAEIWDGRDVPVHVPDFTVRPKNELSNYSWEDVLKNIAARGLAKRSWFWSIKKLRDGKAIPNATSLYSITTPKGCGLIMANRLNYIRAVTPAGVEGMAASAASNQIMAQVAKKMEREFGIKSPRLAAKKTKAATKTLGAEFKRAERDVVPT
jgi:hypothetical protein